MQMRRKHRVGQYVFNDDALAQLKRRAFLDAVEVIQKFLLKAALGDDLQRAAFRVIELHVAEIRTEQGNSRIEDFLQQRLELGRRQQPRTKFVQARHGGQLGGEFIFYCQQRLSAGDELLSQLGHVLGPARKLSLQRVAHAPQFMVLPRDLSFSVFSGYAQFVFTLHGFSILDR
jgi:hypothetical protein